VADIKALHGDGANYKILAHVRFFLERETASLIREKVLSHQMTAREKNLLTNSVQSRRFIDAAKELGCDTDEVKFNATLGKVARHKPASERPPAKDSKKDYKGAE
jgi:hypothetical protein